jgi:hypothetical protein
MCTPSSVPTSKPGKINAIIYEKVAELNLNATGVIVIDFMVNSAYLSTNEDGIPSRGQKPVKTIPPCPPEVHSCLPRVQCSPTKVQEC